MHRQNTAERSLVCISLQCVSACCKASWHARHTCRHAPGLLSMLHKRSVTALSCADNWYVWPGTARRWGHWVHGRAYLHRRCCARAPDISELQLIFQLLHATRRVPSITAQCCKWSWGFDFGLNLVVAWQLRHACINAQQSIYDTAGPHVRVVCAPLTLNVAISSEFEAVPPLRLDSLPR